MNHLAIQSQSKEEIIDITDQLTKIVTEAGISEGHCIVYVPHTTAGVTINENADPSVKSDILLALSRVVPDSLPFRHSEGNSTAHVKSSLIGSSIIIPVQEGRLALGTWQGVCFCEFDGPRHRKILIQVTG